MGVSSEMSLIKRNSTEVYLYVSMCHMEWQGRCFLQTIAPSVLLSFFSWNSLCICMISFLTIERSRLFKGGGCINWLGKSAFYSLSTAMWTPAQCIRNRPSFRIMEGDSEGGKMHVFKPEALLNWWAYAVKLFRCRSHLHNTKVVRVGAESSSSCWSGRGELLLERRLRCSESETRAGGF